MKNMFETQVKDQVAITATILQDSTTNQMPTVVNPEQAKALSVITEDYIMNIGVDTAKGVKELSTKILSNVKNTSGDEMGQKLNELIGETKRLSVENYRASPLKKFANKFLAMKDKAQSEFQSASDRIDLLVKQLDKEKQGQISDRALIDQMALENYNYCKATLTDIDKAKADIETIEAVMATYVGDLDFERKRELDDLQAKHDLLYKKLVDLEATKLLSMNLDPRFKSMRQGSLQLVSTFDNIVYRGIPIYMQNFAAYVISSRQEFAANVSDKSIDLFNEAIVKGSELAAKNAESIARVSQRQLVSAETLKKDHENMVNSLETVAKIMEESRVNRKAMLEQIKGLEQDTINRFSRKS